MKCFFIGKERCRLLFHYICMKWKKILQMSYCYMSVDPWRQSSQVLSNLLCVTLLWAEGLDWAISGRPFQPQRLCGLVICCKGSKLRVGSYQAALRAEVGSLWMMIVSYWKCSAVKLFCILQCAALPTNQCISVKILTMFFNSKVEFS